MAIPFHDWVKVEHQGWVRRDTQIIQELAGRPEVRCLLVINRPSSIPTILRGAMRREGWRTKSGDLVKKGRSWWLRRVRQKLFALDVFVPDIFHTIRLRHAWWSRALDERHLRGAVRSAYEELELHDPISWCFTPIGAPLAASLPRSAFVFDAIDDWLEHPEMQPYRRAAREGYEVVTDQADLITCVAQDLCTRFQGSRAPVHWIPNGVGPEFFALTTNTPVDIAAIPRPRAGYVGVIERRLDLDLIADVARRLPRVQFCFVGPDRIQARRILKLSNCHFLGKRDFSQMPGYISAFDVALIPHLVDRATASMNPLKLYEYLAAGKPVVSTPIAGTEMFPGCVAVADTAEKFAQSVQSALSGSSGPIRRCQDVAREHSWTGRVDRILRELAAAVPTLSLDTANAESIQSFGIVT